MVIQKSVVLNDDENDDNEEQKIDYDGAVESYNGEQKPQSK